MVFFFWLSGQSVLTIQIDKDEKTKSKRRQEYYYANVAVL